MNASFSQASFRHSSVHAGLFTFPRSLGGDVASSDCDLKEQMADLSERIYIAYRTLRRLPDRERSLLMASRRGSWPELILTYWEAYGQNAARVKLSPPSSAAVSDMERVMEWMSWLGRVDRTMMNCVYVCCGRGLEPTQASDVLGLHRNTIRLRRDAGLERLAERFGSKK